MKINSQQKRGIIKLAILLGLLCFFIGVYNWLPRTAEHFVLDTKAQQFIEQQKDSLQAEAKKRKPYTYYVNSINDYSGYKLGLSPKQMDRLLDFRKSGNKIYDLKKFAEVTQIETAKLDTIKHLLVFPKAKKFNKKKKFQKKIVASKIYDINKITSEQLQGELKLPDFVAKRIVKFRTYLKGFRSMEQLNDVYSILPYQIKRLNENCTLINPPSEKKKLHELSVYELSKIPYINVKQSEQIIKFVKNNGKITSFQEFHKIEDFPKDKIARLPLYLSLN